MQDMQKEAQARNTKFLKFTLLRNSYYFATIIYHVPCYFEFFDFSIGH